MTTRDFQRLVGITQDGVFGPKTRDAFMRVFVNKRAPAITETDMQNAARRIGVPVANLKALAEKESGRGAFSREGRPVILFEAHWFSRLTNRRFDRSHPHISSRRWDRRLYARHMPGRYQRMADAAALDFDAALQSASWGRFQIMGFHWQRLGYASPMQFALAMVSSEANHLDALVRFIEAHNLARALRSCRPNDPQSCVEFARRYNGPAFARNRYHTKLARLIARHA